MAEPGDTLHGAGRGPRAVAGPEVPATGWSSSSARASEWDDPKLEWRRLFSELLGTFLLVLVAAGGGIWSARVRSASPRRSSPRA